MNLLLNALGEYLCNASLLSCHNSSSCYAVWGVDVLCLCRKYKDGNLLGQESDEGGGDGALDTPPVGASGSRPPVTMLAEDDSEEEIDTGEIRRYMAWSLAVGGNQ